MAELTINIPDGQIPRLRDAAKTQMVEGDAVDLENPTNQEVISKLQELCIERLMTLVQSYERHVNNSQFVFDDLNMS
jgi:hypothetical protein